MKRSIHDVPYDGNCMFSSISHQLQTSKVLADHLEANAVCQPVADNEYNANTEPPTAEDEYIDRVHRQCISDPKLQTQLRWEKYLRCLRQGALG